GCRAAGPCNLNAAARVVLTCVARHVEVVAARDRPCDRQNVDSVHPCPAGAHVADAEIVAAENRYVAQPVVINLRMHRRTGCTGEPGAPGHPDVSRAPAESDEPDVSITEGYIEGAWTRRPCRRRGTRRLRPQGRLQREGILHGLCGNRVNRHVMDAELVAKLQIDAFHEGILPPAAAVDGNVEVRAGVKIQRVDM